MEEKDVDIMTPDRTFCTIPCSICKLPIQPNSPNTLCVKCLPSKNDITLGLHKKHYLRHCPQCKTYKVPPKTRIKLPFKSKQFLAFCIKELEKNLSSKNVTLLRSQTIPTPPDSKIIKIRVYVQKEVPNGGAPLQHSYVVEFVQHNRICDPCSRVQPNPDQWNSLVQLKPQPCDMRNFFHLEWVILRPWVVVNDVRTNKVTHGIDLFFPDRSCAIKFLDFVKGQVPVRISESKGFVSQVIKSNCYSYRYNFSVEVCPITPQDLIFLPPKVALSLGNIGPIVICTKVTNVITLFDPLTSTQCCLDGDMYWSAPFKSLLTRKELVEYAVLDVKEVCSEVIIDGKKFGLAKAEVALVNDLGKNDTRFSIKTHLGYLLKTGDRALGYDLWDANCSDSEIELKEHIGDGVILIRKTYGLNRLMKRRVEHQSYLKDLEQITNEVLDISLGGKEPPLEEKLGDLNLSGEEHKEKKARRMA